MQYPLICVTLLTPILLQSAFAKLCNSYDECAVAYKKNCHELYAECSKFHKDAKERHSTNAWKCAGICKIQLPYYCDLAGEGDRTQTALGWAKECDRLIPKGKTPHDWPSDGPGE